ncbi:MAG TPA: DUF192 domain-containing protein [Opitutaceae bacterium]|nr:DUF192 domain-containing protein [Opitutaceae bacterium]HRJ45928.1 DUF192 domain-containing protein [Opitutaceae bacterium]
MKNANPVSWAWRGWLVLIIALGLAGCARSEANKPAPSKTVADWFVIKVDGHPVRMQLAVLEAEMQRGLMGRRELGRDDGMLFVYLRPTRLSFWMRNTPLPLDIGYFTPAGVLAEIYALHPFDETPVAARSAGLQFALEMNQGWFHANEVRPGARLDLAALAAALKERGFNPKDFGLP